ncbi:hypothetical protein D3C73_576610 [compost metagenome]
METLFFRADDFGDVFAVLDYGRVVDPHHFAYGFGKAEQEWTVQAQRLAVAHCAAEQTADNIAAAFIGRKHAVTHGKRYRTDVVGNDLQRNILLQIVLVGDTGKLRRLLNNRLEQISVKVRVHILQNRRETLQTGTGINILVRKRRIAAVFVVVELREYEVPHFEPAFIFPARIHFRIGQVAAVGFAAVIEDFRARAARAFADIPEVVVAQLDDALCGQSDFFIPQLERFFVLSIYRYGNTVRIKADPLLAGQELPSPGNRFFLEVVTDGEVAQHLKKRMVAARFAHILDIVGTNAFLGVGQTRILRNFPAVKISLQRCHPGIDPQQRGVIMRHERCARLNSVAFALKKLQPFGTDFTCFHHVQPLSYSD